MKKIIHDIDDQLSVIPPSLRLSHFEELCCKKALNSMYSSI